MQTTRGTGGNEPEKRGARLPGRRFLAAPDPRSRASAIFPDEVIACIRAARSPTSAEVAAVAAKIWRDVQRGRARIRWRDLAPGSARHRRMISAAYAALAGAVRGGGVVAIASPESAAVLSLPVHPEIGR